MTDEIAISLQSVSKKYKLYDKPIDRLKEALNPFKKQYHKDFYALKDINLNVKKGEVLGIVGVNGAGKSTLLKIITDVVSQSSGTVKVNGRVNAILELSAGLNAELNGIDNIKLNLKINGILEDQARYIKEIVEFADIGEHINQPVKTYSSGMKARLSFGIAHASDPDILILDEVLAVGDVVFQRKCYARIEQFINRGKTVLFVSHSANAVVRFCTRAVLIHDRQIIMSGKPKDVTDYYEKLLFSVDKRSEAQKIKNQKSNSKTNAEKPKDKVKALKVSPENINPQLFEFFDSKICNFNNEVLNLLEKGQRYQLKFKVQANKTISRAYFGAQIMTLDGLVLTGCNNEQLTGKTVDQVYAGNVYHVVVEFDNLLLPRSYIVMIFGIDYESGDIAKQTNSYLFKVKTAPYNQAGYVTLNQVIKVYKESGELVVE